MGTVRRLCRNIDKRAGVELLSQSVRPSWERGRGREEGRPWCSTVCDVWIWRMPQSQGSGEGGDPCPISQAGGAMKGVHIRFPVHPVGSN